MQFLRSHFIKCLGLGLALFAGWTAYIYLSVPVEQLRGSMRYMPPGKTYTRQAGLGVSENLKLEEMPLSLILATIVTEDHRFAAHQGIDLQNSLAVIYRGLAMNRRIGAGSTITQQVAKNLFTNGARTLYRKYIEMLYAMQIEKHYNKPEIFVLYANIAQTGPDWFGFKEAAEQYFHKPAQELTTMEAVFIVDLLPAPASRSAWFREHTLMPVGGGAPDQDRLAYNLSKVLLLQAALDAAGTHPNQRQIFTDPMLSTDDLPPLPEEQFRAIMRAANQTAKAFIDEHAR